MNEIHSIKLGVSPGPKFSFVEIHTLTAAGKDVGYRGVLAAKKQYRASFDFIFTPDGGSEERTKVFGTGGTEPFWGGKRREDVNRTDEDVTDDNTVPDADTGPNPGYGLNVPSGFGCGQAAWIWDLGCRLRLNHKKAPNGNLTIKGHIDGIGSTQSEVFRVEDGKLKRVV